MLGQQFSWVKKMFDNEFSGHITFLDTHFCNDKFSGLTNFWEILLGGKTMLFTNFNNGVFDP